MAAHPILQFGCRAVHKSFDTVSVLSGVNLELEVPGIGAIIGPNGAGKTTLFNILSGFLQPEVGKIFLGNEDLTGCRPHEMVKHGVVRSFQELRLIRSMTAAENVLLSASEGFAEGILGALFRVGVQRTERMKQSDAVSLLHAVGLAGSETHLAGALSYGQQKLLSTACCMAASPRILLLDEPFAGLDRRVAPRMGTLIRECTKTGSLVLFIEHDIGAVRELAETVIVMDRGLVIAQGQTDDILARPDILEAYVG